MRRPNTHAHHPHTKMWNIGCGQNIHGKFNAAAKETAITKIRTCNICFKKLHMQNYLNRIFQYRVMLFIQNLTFINFLKINIHYGVDFSVYFELKTNEVFLRLIILPI